MIVFPNAKINLGLSIVGKRADGYHDIESVFYPVPWQDALEVIPSSRFTFSTSGITIPPSEGGNLCERAYHLLSKDFSISPGQMHLHKHIPIGAGLGGGSSDAAFCLRLFNELFELKLDEGTLEEYARQLGSDCAFFIKNKPCFAYQKGDVFEELALDLKGYYLVLIYPGIHIGTAEAYAQVNPKPPPRSPREISREEPRLWKSWLKNDFESSLFTRYPVLSQIKSELYRHGATYASMTGSGSCLFGLFEKEIDLRNFFPNSYSFYQGFL